MPTLYSRAEESAWCLHYTVVLKRALGAYTIQSGNASVDGPVPRVSSETRSVLMGAVCEEYRQHPNPLRHLFRRDGSAVAVFDDVGLTQRHLDTQGKKVAIFG